MFWKKVFRICRLSKSAFFEWAIEPIFNKRLILTFASLVITFLFYSYFFGEGKMMDEINNLTVPALTLFGAYGIYLLIGIICAPCIAYKKEKEKGEFFGKRFVYHKPYHICTTIIKPEDHEQAVTFLVKDAEPNSSVCFDFKYRGGLGCISVVGSSEYVKNSTHAANLREQQLTHRIDKHRKVTLRYVTAPNSDDTQLRVYMLSWEY